MGDTGATGHMTWNESELTDVVETYVPVIVANGAKEICRKKGKFKGFTKYGEYFVLRDVHVVPGLNKKLISLTKLTAEGSKMSTENKKLFIEKGKSKLTFDLRNENGKFLYYLELGKQEVNDIQVQKENQEEKQVKNEKVGYQCSSWILSFL